MQRNKGISPILLRKHLTGVELDTQCGHMRCKQNVRDYCTFDQFRILTLPTRLLVLSDIRERPTVEPTLFYRCHIVRDQVVPETISLIYRRPQLPGARVPGQAYRVSKT